MVLLYALQPVCKPSKPTPGCTGGPLQGTSFILGHPRPLPGGAERPPRVTPGDLLGLAADGQVDGLIFAEVVAGTGAPTLRTRGLLGSQQTPERLQLLRVGSNQRPDVAGPVVPQELRQVGIQHAGLVVDVADRQAATLLPPWERRTLHQSRRLPAPASPAGHGNRRPA
jgi:hypothetical protein